LQPGKVTGNWRRRKRRIALTTKGALHLKERMNFYTEMKYKKTLAKMSLNTIL
jgi:hypothetical protein